MAFCWTVSSALQFPHTVHVERRIRTIKEPSRPSHLQAGFHKRLWPVTINDVSQALSSWGMAPIPNKEPGTDAGNFKLDKTRWGVMTGSRFLGPMYPLLDSSSTVQKEVEWQSSLTTKPGLFAGWKLESGLWCRDTVLVLDDDATRHLHWQPKAVRVKAGIPLANAAKCALKNTSKWPAAMSLMGFTMADYKVLTSARLMYGSRIHCLQRRG